MRGDGRLTLVLSAAIALPGLVPAQIPPELGQLAPLAQAAPLVQAAPLARRPARLATLPELAALSSAEAAWARNTFFRGDGRAADVADLLIVQTRFIDSACPPHVQCAPNACNVVTLLWLETQFNDRGVQVFADGQSLGIIPGLPDAELPGVNGVNILQVPPGAATFRIEDPGSGATQEDDIVVLDSQPLSDPSEVRCGQGNVGENGCELEASWTFAEPMPTTVTVQTTGVGTIQVDAAVQNAVFPGASAGEQCVLVTGFLENAQGTYRSCPVQSCCQLSCEPPPRPLFIRGICSGTAAAPNISQPIFTLNYLFLGGELPPCLEACDCNDDGNLNLTDPVCVLNFLFFGGAPPAGWVDRTPTCRETQPGDDCQTGNASC